MGEKNRSEILSKEFKIACEIHRLNKKGEKVWFTKLRDSLKDKMSPSTLMNGLRTLFDWGIVKAEYGQTDTGRAGRLLFISGESKHIIEEIYEEYWKPSRPN